MSDAVNHPKHYAQFKHEPIDVIEDWGLGFCLGNTVKYIARAGHKDPGRLVEDLEKAAWYLRREIDAVKSRRLNNATDQSALPDNPQAWRCLACKAFGLSEGAPSRCCCCGSEQLEPPSTAGALRSTALRGADAVCTACGYHALSELNPARCPQCHIDWDRVITAPLAATDGIAGAGPMPELHDEAVRATWVCGDCRRQGGLPIPVVCPNPECRSPMINSILGGRP